jgi:microsomal dipeptidase-like Zn-dependent dipeptidase
MAIDLSHCNAQTCLDTVEHSSRPVTIAHGNPAERLGVDAIAIGTDYDTGWPESRFEWFRTGRWSRESAIPLKSLSPWRTWFRNPSDFPNISEGLSRRGFSDEEVVKIVGGNWLKFFREGFSPEGAHRSGFS